MKVEKRGEQGRRGSGMTDDGDRPQHVIDRLWAMAREYRPPVEDFNPYLGPSLPIDPVWRVSPDVRRLVRLYASRFVSQSPSFSAPGMEEHVFGWRLTVDGALPPNSILLEPGVSR